MPRDPAVLARDLLGRAADDIEPLVVWPDRATYRVDAGGRTFVLKADDNHETVRGEAVGHRRAAALGVRVPELLAVTRTRWPWRGSTATR